MPIKYKVDSMKQRDHKTGQLKTIYFASTRLSGKCTFDDLCNRISDRSTATAGDIKLVLDGLYTTIVYHLQRGESVHLGELGHFRPILRSSSAETREEFTAEKITGVRVSFLPGTKFRKELQDVKIKFIGDVEMGKEETEPSENSENSETSED